MDSQWARAAVMAAALIAALPVAAQEAQGPPDGYIPPAPTRPAGQPAQGPDNSGIPPIATPQPRQPTPAPTITIPVQPTPQRSATPPAAQRPRAATPVQPGSAVAGAPEDAAPLPPPVLPPPAPMPETIAEPMIDEAPMAAPVPATTGEAAAWLPSWWPWALALLAALVASAWWMRRDRSSAALVDGSDEVAPPPLPSRAPASAPLSRATPSVVPPTPAPTPPIAPPPPQRDVGRAKLAMTLQVDAIDVLADSARISFSLLLANQGDRAATGGLVRIALQQANRRQAELLERFFDGAGGSVLAEDVEIAPGDVGTIKRHALLALDQVEPMLVAGYPSLIPVIGFDVTYHWDGEGEAFGQIASAFVLGSSAAADGRIAPVRLDLPPRRLTSPAARVTEMLRTA
jgi:hypothetical protein